MPRLAIPDFGMEYPEYEYRAWPKYVGLDEEGLALIAKDQAEFNEMKELTAYPKVLGKDKHGKEIVANNPRDEEWFKSRVVHSDAGHNALTNAGHNNYSGEVRRGPGRPPKEAA
jgi:hypothetical protein